MLSPSNCCINEWMRKLILKLCCLGCTPAIPVLSKAALHKHLGYATQFVLLVPPGYYQFSGVTAAHSSCLNSENLVENEDQSNIWGKRYTFTACASVIPCSLRYHRIMLINSNPGLFRPECSVLFECTTDWPNINSYMAVCPSFDVMFDPRSKQYKCFIKFKIAVT